MQQMTLAHQAGFERYRKKTRREQFLEEMDGVMPWVELLALVAPYYAKGEMGRKPVGLAIMLRVYFLQQWFALSDPSAEDARYESAVMRRFAGIDLGRAPAPDETTILNFRHLLEEHELCGQMLDTVNHYLESKGNPPDCRTMRRTGSASKRGLRSRFTRWSRNGNTGLQLLCPEVYLLQLLCPFFPSSGHIKLLSY